MKDAKMIEAMMHYGGGFCTALAVALQRADSENYAKLVKAFPEEIAKYKAFAKKDEASTKS